MYLYILPLTFHLLKRVMSAVLVVLLKSYPKIYQNLFQDVPDYSDDQKKCTKNNLRRLQFSKKRGEKFGEVESVSAILGL